MIEKSKSNDLQEIYEIINDAAIAYKDIIPSDCWREPYMPMNELRTQIKQGVEFWCYKEDRKIFGVMGIQDRGDVTLIRHAYVLTISRNKGIGGKLLAHLITLTNKPVLIGTWAAASWAIEFYRKHGFRLLSEDEKNKLLQRYWMISKRQTETSVVLANVDWKSP
jgi:N-acetylglutamate synthase-like GNAT family acetyltransferase